MINIGTMIIILIMFLVAIGVSFYSGFSIGKKQVKVIQPKAEYIEPNQSFFEKITEFIEDTVIRKKSETKSEDVKLVKTKDGILKNDNEFY